MILVMSLNWFYPLISVVVVSLIPLIGIAFFFSSKRRITLVSFLISLAVGALFGNVFIHLVPEIMRETANQPQSSFYIVLGILAFFVLEKFLNWHHHHSYEHTEDYQGRILPIGYLILVADGLHNFIDGAIIAASYSAGLDVGVATTLAVVLHEVPQEIGDIGILLHAGFTKAKALVFNLLSGSLAILGAVITLFIAGAFTGFASFILPLAAGGFIYIAGSDLVPELQRTADVKKSVLQLMFMVLGMALMFALLLVDIV